MKIIVKLIFLPILVSSSLLAIAEEQGSSKIDTITEKPRISILYTTDTNGYVKPCGCGGHKAGGLARRATFIRDYVNENKNTLIVDSGGLAYIEKQTALILDAMKHMGYDTVGIADIDARLGDNFFALANKYGVLVLDARPNQPSSVRPYIVKEVGGFKVGVISFGSILPQSSSNANKMALLKSRYKAFSEARKSCDLLVLLDQAGVATEDWLTRNSERLGSPDLVIGTSSRGIYMASRNIGKTVIAPVTVQAKSIGVVKIYGTDKANLKITAELIDLVEKIPEDPDILELIAQHERDYQNK